MSELIEAAEATLKSAHFVLAKVNEKGAEFSDLAVAMIGVISGFIVALVSELTSDLAPEVRNRILGVIKRLRATQTELEETITPLTGMAPR